MDEQQQKKQKKNHELEQALASFREFIPRSWHALYQGCLASGFDESQSFNLLQTYIIATHSKGAIPPSENGPKEE